MTRKMSIGQDEHDPFTASIPADYSRDFVKSCKDDALRNSRIAVRTLRISLNASLKVQQGTDNLNSRQC